LACTDAPADSAAKDVTPAAAAADQFDKKDEGHGEIEVAGSELGPAAAAAAATAGEGACDYDATATILPVGPARRLPPVDIVEYWQQQQMQRMAQDAATAEGNDSAGSRQVGAGCTAEQQAEMGDSAAKCLPLRWSDMLRRLVPSW
jgi:hypothetical protein